MQRSKSLEHENKQLRDIQENLSSTLNRVKVENEHIIVGLKQNLDMKERECQRMSDELKDRQSTTKSILEKEKENSEFKVTLLQNSLNELKSEVSRRSEEQEHILEDNKRL